MRLRNASLAFVLTLAACDRENAPEPATPANAPIVNANPPGPSGDMAVDWSGSWSTDFGILTFSQQGASVTGSYLYNNNGAQVNGQISGTVMGSHLDFTWEEGPGGAGTGHGSFILGADGRSFEGTWGKGGSRTDGGNWNGKKQ